VQHAHQKAVIHRDLKPSTIVVTAQEGGSPSPKMIDFDIAKATQGRLTEKTLFTEMRQFIGTPEYMSPEQADVGAMDVEGGPTRNQACASTLWSPKGQRSSPISSRSQSGISGRCPCKSLTATTLNLPPSSHLAAGGERPVLGGVPEFTSSDQIERKPPRFRG
jgi:serine/threonine protein kinase